MVVVDERGHELVGLAGEEPVAALEPPAQRPAVAPGAEVLLVLGREVPLPHRPGRVAVGVSMAGSMAHDGGMRAS